MNFVDPNVDLMTLNKYRALTQASWVFRVNPKVNTQSQLNPTRLQTRGNIIRKQP